LWHGRTGDRIESREADATSTATVAPRLTLALGARDLDGDLRPELYIANDFGPDRLLHNLSTAGRASVRAAGRRRTPDDAALQGARPDSFKGMGVDFGDIEFATATTTSGQQTSRRRGRCWRATPVVNDGAPGAPLAGAQFVDRQRAARRGARRLGVGRAVRRLRRRRLLEIVQATGSSRARPTLARPSRSWRPATTCCSSTPARGRTFTPRR